MSIAQEREQIECEKGGEEERQTTQDPKKESNRTRHWLQRRHKDSIRRTSADPFRLEPLLWLRGSRNPTSLERSVAMSGPVANDAMMTPMRAVSNDARSDKWSDPALPRTGTPASIASSIASGIHDALASARDANRQQASDGNSDKASEEDGIEVPSILQSLFGLEFIPFQAQEGEHRKSSSSDRPSRTIAPTTVSQAMTRSQSMPRDRISPHSSEPTPTFLRVKDALAHADEVLGEQISQHDVLSLKQEDSPLSDGKAPHDAQVKAPAVSSTDPAGRQNGHQQEQHLDHGEHGSGSGPGPLVDEHSNDNSKGPKRKGLRRLHLKNILRGRRTPAAAEHANDHHHNSNGHHSNEHHERRLNLRLFRRNRVPTWDGGATSSLKPLNEHANDLHASFSADVDFPDSTSDLSTSVRGGSQMDDEEHQHQDHRGRPIAQSQPQPRSDLPLMNSAQFSVWMQQQQLLLEQNEQHLQKMQEDALDVRNETILIYDRISIIHDEIDQLQSALKLSHQSLQKELSNLEYSQQQIKRLEEEAVMTARTAAATVARMQSAYPTNRTALMQEIKVHSSRSLVVKDIASSPEPATPLRKRSPTEASQCSSYMRIHDLNMSNANGDNHEAGSHVASATSSLASLSSQESGDMFYIDKGVGTLLDTLFDFGHNMIIDESARFVPTKDTKHIMDRYRKLSPGYPSKEDSWLPDQVWHTVKPKDILVWTGHVDHNGIGSDWPICKGRALMRASPREVLDLLSDSSQIKRYNKMSQGREDLHILQAGVETTREESVYGFPGAAKITRALNKPKLLPKAIETTSLMHARPLPNGSYMTVLRSVFEDAGNATNNPRGNILTEMLTGVLLMRPANADGTLTEFTTLTHAMSTGVPEMFAKRAGPSSAYNMIKDLQTLFKNQ